MCTTEGGGMGGEVGPVGVDPPSTRESQNHVYGWYVIVTLVLLICVGF